MTDNYAVDFPKLKPIQSQLTNDYAQQQQNNINLKKQASSEIRTLYLQNQLSQMQIQQQQLQLNQQELSLNSPLKLGASPKKNQIELNPKIFTNTTTQGGQDIQNDQKFDLKLLDQLENTYKTQKDYNNVFKQGIPQAAQKRNGRRQKTQSMLKDSQGPQYQVKLNSVYQLELPDHHSMTRTNMQGLLVTNTQQNTSQKNEITPARSTAKNMTVRDSADLGVVNAYPKKIGSPEKDGIIYQSQIKTYDFNKHLGQAKHSMPQQSSPKKNKDLDLSSGSSLENSPKRAHQLNTSCTSLQYTNRMKLQQLKHRNQLKKVTNQQNVHKRNSSMQNDLIKQSTQQAVAASSSMRMSQYFDESQLGSQMENESQILANITAGSIMNSTRLQNFNMPDFVGSSQKQTPYVSKFVSKLGSSYYGPSQGSPLAKKVQGGTGRYKNKEQKLTTILKQQRKWNLSINKKIIHEQPASSMMQGSRRNDTSTHKDQSCGQVRNSSQNVDEFDQHLNHQHFYQDKSQSGVGLVPIMVEMTTQTAQGQNSPFLVGLNQNRKGSMQEIAALNGIGKFQPLHQNSSMLDTNKMVKGGDIYPNTDLMGHRYNPEQTGFYDKSTQQFSHPVDVSKSYLGHQNKSQLQKKSKGVLRESFPGAGSALTDKQKIRNRMRQNFSMIKDELQREKQQNVVNKFFEKIKKQQHLEHIKQNKTKLENHQQLYMIDSGHDQQNNNQAVQQQTSNQQILFTQQGIQNSYGNLNQDLSYRQQQYFTHQNTKRDLMLKSHEHGTGLAKMEKTSAEDNQDMQILNQVQENKLHLINEDVDLVIHQDLKKEGTNLVISPTSNDSLGLNNRVNFTQYNNIHVDQSRDNTPSKQVVLQNNGKEGTGPQDLQKQSKKQHIYSNSNRNHYLPNQANQLKSFQKSKDLKNTTLKSFRVSHHEMLGGEQQPLSSVMNEDFQEENLSGNGAIIVKPDNVVMGGEKVIETEERKEQDDDPHVTQGSLDGQQQIQKSIKPSGGQTPIENSQKRKNGVPNIITAQQLAAQQKTIEIINQNQKQLLDPSNVQYAQQVLKMQQKHLREQPLNYIEKLSQDQFLNHSQILQQTKINAMNKTGTKMPRKRLNRNPMSDHSLNSTQYINSQMDSRQEQSPLNRIQFDPKSMMMGHHLRKNTFDNSQQAQNTKLQYAKQSPHGSPSRKERLHYNHEKNHSQFKTQQNSQANMKGINKKDYFMQQQKQIIDNQQNFIDPGDLYLLNKISNEGGTGIPLEPLLSQMKTPKHILEQQLGNAVIQRENATNSAMSRSNYNELSIIIPQIRPQNSLQQQIQSNNLKNVQNLPAGQQNLQTFSQINNENTQTLRNLLGNSNINTHTVSRDLQPLQKLITQEQQQALAMTFSKNQQQTKEGVTLPGGNATQSLSGTQDANLQNILNDVNNVQQEQELSNDELLEEENPMRASKSKLETVISKQQHSQEVLKSSGSSKQKTGGKQVQMNILEKETKDDDTMRNSHENLEDVAQMDMLPDINNPANNNGNANQLINEQGEKGILKQAKIAASLKNNTSSISPFKNKDYLPKAFISKTNRKTILSSSLKSQRQMSITQSLKLANTNLFGTTSYMSKIEALKEYEHLQHNIQTQNHTSYRQHIHPSNSQQRHQVQIEKLLHNVYKNDHLLDSNRSNEKTDQSKDQLNDNIIARKKKKNVYDRLSKDCKRHAFEKAALQKLLEMDQLQM